LGGLWALEWAWHIAEINLRCVRSSGICMPNLNSLALIVSEISAFIRTDGQTDMARSTRLVILIKNVYTLWAPLVVQLGVPIGCLIMAGDGSSSCPLAGDLISSPL